MPRGNDGDHSDLECDVTVTFRNVPGSRAGELARLLESLSLNDPTAGPNPYASVAPVPGPEVQVTEHPASSRRSEVAVVPEPFESWVDANNAFVCSNCNRSTRTAPGEGVFCRNRECHLSPRYQPPPAESSATCRPVPPPVNQLGCRWCQAIKKAGHLVQCGHRPELGENVCSQYHRDWRARGGRLVEDLSAAELLQLVRPHGWVP